jgi:phosphotransacetylase
MSLDHLLTRARESGARVLLAGGDEAALHTAADQLRKAGLAGVGVVGAGGIEPENDPRHLKVAELLRARAPERVRDGIHALDLAADPLRFAGGLLALGDADAVVAGPGVSVRALADLARWTLGPPDGACPVSAASYLLRSDGTFIACADCGLNGSFGPRDRAALARVAAAAFGRISGGESTVAFLAAPDGQDQASEALSHFQALAPGIVAAADGAARFRASPNVLIFPDGTAGHLAVRTALSLGGVRLLGPLLLGPPGVLAGVTTDAEAEELIGTAAAAMLAADRSGT